MPEPAGRGESQGRLVRGVPCPADQRHQHEPAPRILERSKSWKYLEVKTTLSMTPRSHSQVHIDASPRCSIYAIRSELAGCPVVCYQATWGDPSEYHIVMTITERGTHVCSLACTHQRSSLMKTNDLTSSESASMATQRDTPPSSSHSNEGNDTSLRYCCQSHDDAS